jgi:hypothetical protein
MFSTIASVRADVARVTRDFAPERLSAAQAVELVEQLGVVRNLIDGMLAKAAKRVDDTRAHRGTGDRDAAALCGRLTGTVVRDQRRAIETAVKLEALPATDAAVRDGRLSARKAQMIADAATINPDAEDNLIVTAAEGLVPLRDACIAARAVVEDGVARAKRQYHSRFFRMWQGDDGMLEGRFRFAPEVGAAFKVALDTATQRIFRERHAQGVREPHDRHAADALVATVIGGRATTVGTNSTVHVVIDHAALVRGDVSAGDRCEIPGVGPVSVAWVRDLIGSAFLTAVIKRGKDITTVAHYGRHIPVELQTAMIVGGRECDIENCNCRGYLERDHSEVDYAAGGPTAYWNLAWLCYVHHLRKSQGWKLGPRNPLTGKRSLSPPGADEVVAA